MLRRSLVIAGLALSLTTCRDAFEPGASASIAVAPIFPSASELSAFGLTIDGVRFIVVRPATDTLADTTVALAPGLTELAIDIRVPVLSSHDSVSITVMALGGGATLPLFAGTRMVPVPTPLPPPEIPLDTYLGPAVDSIVIQPRVPFILLGDSLRLQVSGFNAGAPVSQFYVAWSTSDTGLARINPLGVLRAPGSRSAVRVRARTPSGAVDSVTATFTPAATQLVLVAGGAQTQIVGTVLPIALEVEARAADGLGVGGVPIRFRALTGGGSVADTLVVTDGAGRARTAATLGTLLGAQAFEASAAGLTGSPVAFSALALAGPVSQILAIVGDGQLAVVGAALASLPSVRVRDAAGNPVAGVSVAFAVASGGGNVAGPVQVTDANGVATVGGWTLGTLAGTNTLAATAGGLTRTFTATGVAGAATQLLAAAGDLQSAVVGTALAIAPAVRALDQFGNAVAGAAVTFAPSGGGGGVIGGTQLTNAAGVATVGGWTLGTVAGANGLTATLVGLTPVAFTATGLAGAATQIVQLAGDGQTAIVNTILPTAPAVIVRDQFNNPVPGVGVGFAPVSGGGIVTGAAALTDAAGVASVGSWRLGTLVGQNTLTASASGLAGSPVGFTGTGTRDVAFQLLRVSTDTQTATAGGPVGIPPAVRVADQHGNGVPGVSVTFALTGALLGSLTPSVATTDTAGVARVGTWTLATLGGLNTLDATVTGLAGSPMPFSANGIVTTATTMTLNAGDGQSGLVSTALSIPYAVRLLNVLGFPVQNVPVNWTVDAAGGSMNPPTSLTDANGIASSMRTLGPGVGTQTATATHGGVPPVTFTATALAGAAVQLVPQSVTQQIGTVATGVTPPVVKVVDQSGNAVGGVIVNFAAAGGGTLGATQVTSDPAGLASAGSWTLGSVAGSNTVTVSSVGPNRVFTATGLAGAPDRLRFILQPTRGLAGNTMAPVQVAIEDKFGNRVPSAQDFVTLDLLPGSNPAAKLVPPTLGAGAVNGVATFPDFAIDSAGFGNALLATAGARTGAQSDTFSVGGVIGTHTTDTWRPVAAAVNPVTGIVYAPGAGNILGVLDPGKPPVIQVQGFVTPFGVAVDSVTNLVYVTGVAGVIVVDGRPPHGIVTTIVHPSLVDPKGIAVDEDRSRVFVAVADPQRLTPPSLVPIDASKNEVLPAIPFEGVEGGGVGVAYNPNDRLVYVAVPSFGLLVIDPATSRQVDQFPLVDKGGRAVGTYGVAIDVTTNLVYATNPTEGTVSIIDPVRREELRRIAVGAAPEGVGVDGVRRLAFVANSGDGTVSFINTDPGKLNVIATLVVGPATSTPKAAAVNAATGQVFVPTFADDQVRVIQP